MQRYALKKNIHYFLFLCFFSNGCAGFTKTRYSKPVVAGQAREKLVEHIEVNQTTTTSKMFVVDDLAFAVSSNNEKTSSLMIIPFPLPFREPKKSKDKNLFTLYVSLLTEKTGFRVNPSQIAFWEMGNQPIYPVSLEIPAPCPSPFGTQNNSQLPTKLPITPFELVPHIKTCFQLIYEAKTPDPKKQFSVQLGGITQDNKKRNLPIITFQQKKKIDTFALP